MASSHSWQNFSGKRILLSKKKEITKISINFGESMLNLFWTKTDRVGPLITDPPTNSSKKFSAKKCYMGHLTPDNWHLTYDTIHMTSDTLHVTCDMWWGLNISQIFSSPALTIQDRQCFEDSEQKDQSMNKRYLWNNPGYTGSVKQILHMISYKPVFRLNSVYTK